MTGTPDTPFDAPVGSVWCIVVAAGSGTRFGAAKQFEQLAGRRVVDRAVATAASVCDGVVVVLPPGAGEDLAPPGCVAVAGGVTRSDSVRAGLDGVPGSARVVLVHDAARPLASEALFERVITAVREGAVAAVPVVEVVDTVRDLDTGPVDRSRLRSVQTPQGFDADVLRAAHGRGTQATDDAGVVEALGHDVVLLAGERTNLKLTEPSDLLVAAALLAHGAPESAGGAAESAGGAAESAGGAAESAGGAAESAGGAAESAGGAAESAGGAAALADPGPPGGDSQR